MIWNCDWDRDHRAVCAVGVIVSFTSAASLVNSLERNQSGHVGGAKRVGRVVPGQVVRQFAARQVRRVKLAVGLVEDLLGDRRRGEAATAIATDLVVRVGARCPQSAEIDCRST